MGDWRKYTTVISEAELIASEPRDVVHWLKDRAASVKSFDETGDKQLESTLLELTHPLIDLGLARYALHSSTLSELYHRETDAGPVLRLAVLSNSAAGKFNWAFPGDIIGSRHEPAWLGQLSEMELDALFSNPNLDELFLREFLGQEAGWQSLSDVQQQIAVTALYKSLAARGEYEGHWDGYADYSHNAVFDAAWKLAVAVPPNERWGNILGPLYERMRASSFSMKDPLGAAERWRPDDEEAFKSNGRGYLTGKQMVRKGLARLAGRYKEKIFGDVRNHEDVAFRCAAYSMGSMNASDIEAAYERDGALAAIQMMENERIWQTEATRTALSSACWAVSENDPNSDLFVPETFSKKRDKLQAERPEWFRDEAEARSSSVTAQSENPQSVSTVENRVRAVEAALSRHRLWLWAAVAAMAGVILRQ